MRILLTLPILVTFHHVALADVPVIDTAHIAATQRESMLSYAQRAEQLARQVEEIRQINQQIRRMDLYLARLGDPAAVLPSKGAQALSLALRNDVRHQAQEKTSDGLYEPLSSHVMVNGQARMPRDTARYRPERASEDAFARYWVTRDAVSEQRHVLREAIVASTADLKAAQTLSEVSKLQGILLALQAELSGLDQELETASQEALLRFLENENHRQLRAKATREDLEQAQREGVARALDTFRLPAISVKAQ